MSEEPNKTKLPSSPEEPAAKEREQVKANITDLVNELGEHCPNCGAAMALEVVAAYCEECASESGAEKDKPPLEVTTPEDRVYRPDDKYSFLIHVPLGNVEQRLGEIGSERGGVLMTSLVTGQRQETFCGEGGLLLAAPEAEAIRGMSRVDCGGEIAEGHMDDIAELEEPASTADYNQIDLKFDGTEVVGVMIKVTPDGNELRNPKRNTRLREAAETHNLPIATVEVTPSQMPDAMSVVTREFSDGNSLTTYNIPDSDEHFLRVDIAHGSFYHSPGIDTISRSMAIDSYGQVSQLLSPAQKQKIQHTLHDLSGKDALSDKNSQPSLAVSCPILNNYSGAVMYAD